MPKYKNHEEYISNAEPFAQPLLEFFRGCVHEACPSAEEVFKWSMPCFMYKGKILCSMASFKKHMSFGFWLAGHMKDEKGLFVKAADSGMGQFGKMTSEKDLPDRKALIAYIHEAMLLTEQGKTLEVDSKSKKTKVYKAPEYMLDRLKANPKALSTYEEFSQSHKNEYIEWVTEAKMEATRNRRLDQMIEWLEEGKPRNWKYMKK